MCQVKSFFGFASLETFAIITGWYSLVKAFVLVISLVVAIVVILNSEYERSELSVYSMIEVIQE